MEASNSKYARTLYAILTLVLVNLAATGYLILNQRTGQPAITTSGQVPLPPGLDNKDKRNALFEEFRDSYNTQDIDVMFNWFDEAAQFQMDKNQLKPMLTFLHDRTGNIKSGAYLSFLVVPVSGSGKEFTLTYIAKTENGTARLEISVIKDSSEPYRNFRFNMTPQ